MKAFLSLIQALLLLISSFAVPDSNFKFLVDRAAVDVTSTTEISFDSITAEEMAVSAQEKAACRDWYNSNVLCTDSPAYDFTVGGKSLRKNLKDWDISVGTESEAGAVYRGGKTT